MMGIHLLSHCVFNIALDIAMISPFEVYKAYIKTREEMFFMK